MPSTANNIYIYDSSKFVSTLSKGFNSNDQCIAYLGGTFNTSTSISWSGYMMINNSGASIETQPGGNLWGRDSIWMKSSLEVPNTRLGLYQGQGGLWLNAFGLGRNSSTLNTLVEMGALGSTVWSIWAGWTGAESQYQVDGSVVLGGYDAAKTKGDNLTTVMTMDPPMSGGHMIVEITNIVMNLANGDNVTIFCSTTQPTSFQAFISPPDPLISLPKTIWDAFQASAGGTLASSNRSTDIIHQGAMVYEARGV